MMQAAQAGPVAPTVHLSVLFGAGLQLAGYGQEYVLVLAATGSVLEVVV